MKKPRHPIRRVKVPTKCVMLRMPQHMADEIMKHVDGIHYRSRTHLINCILAGWLKEQPLR